MEALAFNQGLAAEKDEQTCPICGNVYEVVQTRESEDTDRFGYIHCVSCGMYTEV